jgi:hypothetical protein
MEGQQERECMANATFVLKKRQRMVLLADRLEDNLKVPKREIFDRSDFPAFYTIKSLREGDFGVKI